MPLDILGCTRATMKVLESSSVFYCLLRGFWLFWDSERCVHLLRKEVENSNVFIYSWLGWMIGIICSEQGIPRKSKSLACVEYVPALCTHRPSLLPIEQKGEISGSCGSHHKENGSKSFCLEEGEVVTRFP